MEKAEKTIETLRNGRTVALTKVSAGQIRPIAPNEIHHAHPFDLTVHWLERPSHAGHSDSAGQEVLEPLGLCVSVALDEAA